MPVLPTSSPSRVLQAEAVELLAGEDHRVLRGGDVFGGLRYRQGQRFRVARLRRKRVCFAGQNLGQHHVARDLDVDRARRAAAKRQHAVDLRRRGFRIVEHGGADGELGEDALLGVEGADLVVEQRILAPLARARRAADDHHRRALGVGLRHRVGDLQPADAVGDAGGAEALQPRVGIGGKTGALLVAGVDDLERALLHLAEEGEHVVAGNAEDVADAFLAEAADQIAADGLAHA